MPFAKKSNYGRKRYTKRYVSKKTTVSKPIQRYVKKQIRKDVELKCFYSNEDETVLASTSQLLATPLLDVDVGTASNQRIGKSIRPVSVHIKGHLANTTAFCGWVRMMLVMVPNSQTNITTTSLLFHNVNGENVQIATKTGLNAIYSAVNKDSFKVLYDKVFRIGPVGSLDGSQALRVNIFKKINHGMQTYTVGDVRSINKRYHLLIFPADAQDDNTVSLEVNLQNRFWYTDA